MENKSILSTFLEEITTNQNHNASIERCKKIIQELESILNKKIISYFATEIGEDLSSMINDEDAFLIDNLLNKNNDKKDLVLILHSNGGIALAAERIIEICKNYCYKKAGQFSIIVPKRAKSAATIVALGADKIFLTDTAELGPVDPQFLIKDERGFTQSEPAYLIVDAFENALKKKLIPYTKINKKFNINNNIRLSDNIKLKLLEQCNYPMYVNAKNELDLSDSIIKKISKDKIKNNSKIKETDFDIFRDPHMTKSHGRLINYSDLECNNLRIEKVINKLSNIDSGQLTKIEGLLWELYVRKRQFLNDVGNPTVKTIEDKEEFYISIGKKIGQQQKPSQE